MFILIEQEEWIVYDQPVCTGVYPVSESSRRWNIMHYVLLANDLFATGIDWALLWTNHKKEIKM